jgi:hypothetical protein
LSAEDYDVWDYSMSLSMSLSMRYPTVSPNYRLASDYPSYVPSDAPSQAPNNAPSIVPSMLKVRYPTMEKPIKLTIPTTSPTWELMDTERTISTSAPTSSQIIIKVEGESSGQSERSHSRLTKVGTSFMTVAIIVVAAAMIFMLFRWRTMRRNNGGQSVDLTVRSPSVSSLA